MLPMDPITLVVALAPVLLFVVVSSMLRLVDDVSKTTTSCFVQLLLWPVEFTHKWAIGTQSVIALSLRKAFVPTVTASGCLSETGSLWSIRDVYMSAKKVKVRAERRVFTNAMQRLGLSVKPPTSTASWRSTFTLFIVAVLNRVLFVTCVATVALWLQIRVRPDVRHRLWGAMHHAKNGPSYDTSLYQCLCRVRAEKHRASLVQNRSGRKVNGSPVCFTPPMVLPAPGCARPETTDPR